MKIREATVQDLPAIGQLYACAKAALKAAGVDQWQGPEGYPQEADAQKDIENGTGYVLTEKEKVIAYACLAFGREPTYETIEGSWQREVPCYGFLHRIAVLPQAKGKGAAGFMFDELKRQAKERGVTVLRGDTHQDNAPMRRVMEKNGLSYRGIIHLEDGSPRLAYECIL